VLSAGAPKETRLGGHQERVTLGGCLEREDGGIHPLASRYHAENDIRRERQMDGIKQARERGIRFDRKSLGCSPEDTVMPVVTPRGVEANPSGRFLEPSSQLSGNL